MNVISMPIATTLLEAMGVTVLKDFMALERLATIPISMNVSS